MPEELPDSAEDSRFTVVMRGYDRDEVDDALARHTEEVARLNRERDEASAAADQAYQRIGNEAGDVLQLAHDWAERTRREADVEATRTTERATDKARRTIDEAEAEAARRVEAAAGSAQRTVQGAEKAALKLRTEAEQDAERTIKDAEATLEALREAEAEARQRIESLRRRLLTVANQLEEDSQEPPPVSLEDGEIDRELLEESSTDVQIDLLERDDEGAEGELDGEEVKTGGRAE